jgi:hypothetical protein
MSQPKQWCVFTNCLFDAVGRTFAPGDGITRSTRRIYGIVPSEAEARALKARLEAGPALSKVRVPGDPFLCPELDVDEFPRRAGQRAFDVPGLGPRTTTPLVKSQGRHRFGFRPAALRRAADR